MAAQAALILLPTTLTLQSTSALLVKLDAVVAGTILAVLPAQEAQDFTSTLIRTSASLVELAVVPVIPI